MGDYMGKAIIGITPGHDKEYKEYHINKCYTEAILSAGGLPVILSVTIDKGIIKEYIEQIDGLLLTGGADVDPLIYGENPLPATGEIDPERDIFELELVKHAYQEKLAILGICKGCQIINIAMGGTLYQDLFNQRKGILKHNQEAPRWYPTHRVNIKKDSYLYKIINQETIKVNSIHHQSIKDVSPNFNISAVAEDGVIEAIEIRAQRFILGVQWHPETMWKNSRENFYIFREFVKQSSSL